MIQRWLAKLITGPFISRAVSSIVALVVGYLSGIGLEIAPDVLNQFGESLGQILQALAGLAVLLLWDTKAAKQQKQAPEQPQVIKSE